MCVQQHCSTATDSQHASTGAGVGGVGGDGNGNGDDDDAGLLFGRLCAIPKKVCSVMPGKSDGGSGDGLICAVQQCCPSQQCSGG